MKALRNFLDKLHPHFAARVENSRDSIPCTKPPTAFMYTPGEVTDGAPHVRDAMDLKRVMITVVFALLPCFFMAMWNTGYQANSAMLLTGGSVEGWRGACSIVLGYSGRPEQLARQPAARSGLVRPHLPGHQHCRRLMGSALLHRAPPRVERRLPGYRLTFPADLPADPAALAGGAGDQLRCCDRQGDFRRHRQKLSQPGA